MTAKHVGEATVDNCAPLHPRQREVCQQVCQQVCQKEARQQEASRQQEAQDFCETKKRKERT